MPARSSLSEVVLLVATLGGGPSLLASCSSPERHDPTRETTLLSCEASNTCGPAGGTLPPITDPVLVSRPCGFSSGCVSAEGGGSADTEGGGTEGGGGEGGAAEAGVIDASGGNQHDAPDARSEAAIADGGTADSSDDARPTDGGQG